MIAGGSIALVVAVADNGVIGANGKLPWRQPSDLRLFRRLTLGKPVIMGRRTLESIGRPLDGRDNIVLSGDPGLATLWPGILVAGTMEAAISLGRERARSRRVAEVMVIGGAGVYAAVLDLADRIYLTCVHARPIGDRYFPPIDAERWREVARRPLERDPNDDYPATFIVLERIAATRA
jgi:dihydrofolate reductase